MRGSSSEACSVRLIRGFAGGVTGSLLFWGRGTCSSDRNFSPFMVSIILSASLAPVSAASSNKSLISSAVCCGCLDGPSSPDFKGLLFSLGLVAFFLVFSLLRASSPLASSSSLGSPNLSSLVVLPLGPRSHGLVVSSW
ncbi:hypothetical protein Salat_0221400 [Sesamum alatum]|uniref:Uncharacterized protein n=1 Tax=Sesamum alatum TaxID=300844 RepID=A0AAE1YZX6_9LAMI|nr:hypothetical protein Salat_0221400 [Sesamum alatum]